MPRNRKVVVLIKGGLGNQLFCYAAARRLAVINGAELVVDDVSGFNSDHQYRREYGLDHFHIAGRKATPSERLQPLGRYRRYLAKRMSNRRAFGQRRYLAQEKQDFDARLLDFNVEKTVYLDGYWQSEKYFKDIQDIIRKDLTITPPSDAINRRISEEINQNVGIALHMRWFNSPEGVGGDNIEKEYYSRAIEYMESELSSPHYFLFSDNIAAARKKIVLPEDRLTLVAHNSGDRAAVSDLWLMTQCRHFITANSTFSWWGAWLGGRQDKIVVTPALKKDGIGSWGFEGLVPEGWTQL